MGRCSCTPAELPTYGVWTCDLRSHRSRVAHFATTQAGTCLAASSPQLVKATPQHYLVTGVEKDRPSSSLVTLQGVAFPPLPIGCGRELHGLSLHREQGTATDVLRTKEGKASERSDRHCCLPSAPGRTRSDYKLQDARCQVLAEIQTKRTAVTPRTATYP